MLNEKEIKELIEETTKWLHRIESGNANWVYKKTRMEYEKGIIWALRTVLNDWDER